MAATAWTPVYAGDDYPMDNLTIANTLSMADLTIANGLSMADLSVKKTTWTEVT